MPSGRLAGKPEVGNSCSGMVFNYGALGPTLGPVFSQCPVNSATYLGRPQKKWNAKAPADLRRLLRRGTNSFSGLSGIGSAGSRQNALHSVVSLVTRVFDQTVIRMPQRDLHGPWFEPRVRIVERHCPRKILRSSALEALDHVKLFAIVHEGFGAVVGGVHDQSVAFPTAARVAVPRFHVGGRMRASIKGDDPGVVDVFLQHDSRRGRLDDLHVAVVAGSDARRAERDAANTEPEVFRTIGALSGRLAEGRIVFDIIRTLRQLLSPCGQSGKFAVFRIDDEGRSVHPVAVDGPYGAIIAGPSVGGYVSLHLSLQIRQSREEDGIAEGSIGVTVLEEVVGRSLQSS